MVTRSSWRSEGVERSGRGQEAILEGREGSGGYPGGLGEVRRLSRRSERDWVAIA